MALIWDLVATFLYFELALGFILSWRFISHKRWSSIFQSSLLATIVDYGSYMFNTMLAVLVVLFIGAVRETMKYSSSDEEMSLQDNLATKDHVMMLMFRGQRNLYITGFALFLFLVLRRMTSLITLNAQFEAKSEAAIKQAESASRAASSLIDNQGEGEEQSAEAKSLEAEIDNIRKEISKCLKEKETSEASLLAMESQKKSAEREFDRVNDELKKIQNSIQSDKKDD